MWEENLDPLDWEQYRALAHRTLDDMVEHVMTIRDKPAWTEMPESSRRALDTNVPWLGEGLEAVYEEFQRHVEPYGIGNPHPRFWGWVPGSGTTGGIVAEIVKAGLNTVPAAFDEFGRFLEQQVVSWMLEAFGMPAEGSGILVSGGSVANFVGLAAARDAQVGFDVRQEGMLGAAGPVAIYASTATHNSVDKAAQLLGLGRTSIRHISVDDDYRIRLDELREAIRADRWSGVRPLIVVGNAASVNTGSIDDLDALADIAADEGMWMHVDGAFGAIAALSPELRPLLRGMERADSLAFDFHKWMHVQYQVGCTLVRSEHELVRPFDVSASYLSAIDRGPGAQPKPSFRYGPELSREAKSLKVWMSIREHGLNRFGRMAEQNVEQARYLGEVIDAEPRLELVAPIGLNIVCLRYLPDRGCPMSDEELNALNTEILMRLQEQGTAVPSHTMLKGRFAIRICFTSHRTRRDDIDLTVREILRLGGELESERAA